MNQLAFVGSDITTAVRDFFHEVGKEIAELWFWPVIFIGFMIFAIITMIFLVRFSYENRILKSVNRLNKYFLAKPYINEENLVEFNLKMKKVPKVLRSNWQVYMLNREDPPTTYINVNTCIDKPLRTSSIEKNMGNFTIFSVFLGLLSFAIGLVYATHVSGTNILGDVLFLALLVPLSITILYTVFYLVIKASKNDIYSVLYENFPLYERNLTKAVTTLPAYVDYEILFSKKEIKDGIPILQHYLEKRARVEEEELERAREASMLTEQYDFSELGVDSSLVLERAMRESETFIKIRRRLQDEKNSIESEKENYKKTFEQTLKDMQRKLQASRENMENLKREQEASTNRIESNYIRKQQADEIKKQEQLEKDIEHATTKFNDEQETLKKEMEKRDQEIEEKREFVEQAMLLEFKHFANTLYEVLTDKAKEVGNLKLVSLAQENADLKALLTDIHGVGLSEEELDPEDSLIQPEEITTNTLYEMSGAEESDLEEGRQTSKLMAADENKRMKEEEKRAKIAAKQEKADLAAAAKAEQRAAKLAAQSTKKEEKEGPSQAPRPTLLPKEEPLMEKEIKKEEDSDYSGYEVSDFSNENENVTNSFNSNRNIEIEEESDADFDNGYQKFSVSDTDELEDEDEIVEDEDEKEVVEEDSDDDDDERTETEDFDDIQKQIDEESDRLQREKMEFENDLNDTILKMRKENDSDQKEQEQKRAEPPQEKVEIKKEKMPERFDDTNDEDEEYDEEYDEDEGYDEDENDESDKYEIKRRPPVRKPPVKSRVNDDKTRKPRATPRRKVERLTRRSTRKEDDGPSELDSLNAEMQKLLKNSNKR